MNCSLSDALVHVLEQRPEGLTPSQIVHYIRPYFPLVEVCHVIPQLNDHPWVDVKRYAFPRSYALRDMYPLLFGRSRAHSQ
jgi:hypothetical protein